jgi:dephospho-CoA kinase
MTGLKVGITGGIGSGKSIVSRVFQGFGIPLFNADVVAKTIMQTDVELKNAIIEAFGASIYNEEGILQRSILADRVFSDPKELTKLNELVHPAAIRAGETWASAQTSIYSLKEAAILFESGSYKSLDAIILVTAPVDLRIDRVMQRDGVSATQVRERMQRQWEDSQKIPLSDFIIQNDELHPVLPQVLEIHLSLVEKAKHATNTF